MDEIARLNRAHWAGNVVRGNIYTLPWHDLDAALIQAYAAGKIDTLPDPYTYIYPRSVLVDAAGKRVLCLASGGGQQSAVFGVLGADVTVVDLVREQLEHDIHVARHLGYEVGAIEGDMRWLGFFPDRVFDLVYQAISLVFVPDVREVYREVDRILKPGGLYRVGFCNPATQTVEESSWDGQGYRIDTRFVPGEIDDADAREYRHLFSDMFNGLIETGFVIREVWEDPRHFTRQADAVPATPDHMSTYVHQEFAVVAWKA